MQRFVDMEAVTRQAESAWAADASIRVEFGTKDVYLAFRRAEAKARGNKVAAAGSATRPAAADADATWDSDEAIRDEFGSKDAYVAFCRAQAAGSFKLHAPSRAQAAAGAASAAPPAGDLASRQASVRQENVGRQFAGLPPLPIPQQ